MIMFSIIEYYFTILKVLLLEYISPLVQKGNRISKVYNSILRVLPYSF